MSSHSRRISSRRRYQWKWNDGDRGRWNVDTIIAVNYRRRLDVLVRAAACFDVQGSGELEGLVVVEAWLDTHHPVAKNGAEVRSDEEVDNEVGGRADDDEHVADAVRVPDGVRAAVPHSPVLEDGNKYLQRDIRHRVTETEKRCQTCFHIQMPAVVNGLKEL